MMRHLPALALSALLLWPLAGAAGCSDRSTGVGSCVPGRQETCPCPGGGSGVQVCGEDGRWLTCDGCPAGEHDAISGDDDATDAIAEDAAADTGPGFADVPVSSSDAVPGDAPIAQTCDPCGYGSLRGVVCAPSRQIYIAQARVRIHVEDCEGNQMTLETVSGPDGGYYFPQVPCGQHRVYVDAGQFQTDFIVPIQAGHQTDITGAGLKQCFAADHVRIAAFWGQWDRMHMILDDLGLNYDFYNFEWEWYNDAHPDDIEALQILRDPARLAEYHILFFNCGSASLRWVNGFPEVRQNLRNFVLAGGSIYASDLAWAYVEGAFPDAIDFYGTNDLPSGAMASDGPQQVTSHQSVAATVEDPVLAQYIGAGSFTAYFGSGPLIAVEAPGPGTTVHVKGLVALENRSGLTGQPLVLSHHPGGSAGRAIYTTFHNDDQADELMRNILYYLVFLL